MEEDAPKSTPKRTIHFAEREVTPAFTLNQVGNIAIRRAREGRRGQFLDVLTAQLMCSLTVEAVLNHVGKKLFLEDADEPLVWAAIERMSPKEKLAAIGERTRTRFDLGKTPFQDLPRMFEFRNALTHAKSLHLHTSDVPPEAIDAEGCLLEDNVPDLQARWERDCDLETAERWRASMYAITDVLCAAAHCFNPVKAGFHTEWSSGIA